MKFLNYAFIATALFIMTTTASCRSTQDLNPTVRLETTYGDIVVRLHAETPLHRDNFMRLVDEGFYDGVLFHRVIADFMIQTGDPESRTATPDQRLGAGDVGERIPAEFAYPVYPRFFHKRGALAAARQGDQVNPERLSSSSQFYIVQGRVFSDEELNAIENQRRQRIESNLFQAKSVERQDEIMRLRQENNVEELNALRDAILAEVHREMAENASFRFTAEQRAAYTTIGGTPHLDGEYTVFGQVIEGLEIVERISQTATGAMNRPIEDIRIISARRVR